MRARVMWAALPLVVSLAAACGGAGTKGPAKSGWGDTAPGGWGNLGVSSLDEVRSQTWDVLVRLRPEQILVTEEANMWKASSAEAADGGSLSVLVIRDPSVTDAWSFAQVLRDDAKEKGADTSDIAPQDFVGRQGARYVSVYPDSGAAALTVVAVSGKCVYVLLAMRGGTKEEIVEYFNWALTVVGTVSGGPANAPACR
jgi:hypothetical protein